VRTYLEAVIAFTHLVDDVFLLASTDGCQFMFLDVSYVGVSAA
jgi:hypothetical protein